MYLLMYDDYREEIDPRNRSLDGIFRVLCASCSCLLTFASVPSSRPPEEVNLQLLAWLVILAGSTPCHWA